MKIAVAGKGGVGKTTITAWFGDYLARCAKTVWLVDADTALSLGQACGLTRVELPEALVRRRDIIQERIRPAGSSIMDLSPQVSDLCESLSIPLPIAGPPLAAGKAGEKRLLVMGALAEAGGGCACESNALLKALLAHLVLEREEWILVDMEAGVEHLGRGTVEHVDQLLIVSEPSLRSLETAAEVGRMAAQLGLARQVLIFNRATPEHVEHLPNLTGLPEKRFVLPLLNALAERQLLSASVLGLELGARDLLDAFYQDLLHALTAENRHDGVQGS